MTDKNIPPLDPQNIIDLIFSSTFYSASDSRGQKLGEYFLIDFLKSIKERNKEDPVAIQYINTLEPILGSALRAFAVEKLNYKRKILPLERLSLGEESAINEHIGIIPLMSVSKASSNWSTLLTHSMFGLVGGSVAASTSIDGGMVKLVSVAVAGASIAVILSSVVIRAIKAFLITRLINRTRIKLDHYWGESYAKYETILFDALISAIRSKEIYYPEIYTFQDGHLFPREALPYLQPPNSASLKASPRPTAEIADELLSIVQARMSIRPDTNRVAWLKSRISDTINESSK